MLGTITGIGLQYQGTAAVQYLDEVRVGDSFADVMGLGAGGGVNATPTNIVTSVSGNQLTLMWPLDHTGWTLQSQTNSAAVGLGATWYDVTGSTATNQMTFYHGSGEPGGVLLLLPDEILNGTPLNLKLETRRRPE